MKTANSTENKISDTRGANKPSIVPRAMPVKAECPKESAKNAMRFETTIVPNMPNNGVISNTANRAFFIKVCSAHEKGNTISISE